MNAPTPNLTMQVGKGPTLTPVTTKTAAKLADQVFTNEELARAFADRYPTNDAFRANFDALWTAANGTMDFYIPKSKPVKLQQEPDQKQVQLFDMAALFYVAIHKMQVAPSDETATGVMFSSRNGKIHLVDGEVKFIASIDPEKSTDKKIVHKTASMEDAFNALFWASTQRNLLPPNKLTINDGTPEERALYLCAVRAHNACVPANLRFELADDTQTTDPDLLQAAISDFQGYMNRAVELADSPKVLKNVKTSDLEIADEKILAVIRDKLSQELKGLKISDETLQTYWKELSAEARKDILTAAGYTEQPDQKPRSLSDNNLPVLAESDDLRNPFSNAATGAQRTAPLPAAPIADRAGPKPGGAMG